MLGNGEDLEFNIPDNDFFSNVMVRVGIQNAPKLGVRNSPDKPRKKSNRCNVPLHLKGKEIINVGVDGDNGGSFHLNDRNGVSSLRMSSLSQGGGGMTFFNLRGKETVFVGTNKINGGQVKTYNGLGSETIFLGQGI